MNPDFSHIPPIFLLKNPINLPYSWQKKFPYFPYFLPSCQWVPCNKVTRCKCVYGFLGVLPFWLQIFHFNNHFKFYINLLMKIHENFHVKGIFHHDKSNRMKIYTGIYLRTFSGYSLFLFISNSEYIGR